MKPRLSIALAYAAVTVLFAACAGPSPSATPFAPEDLAATLPQQVANLQLDVKPQTMETMFETASSDEPFRRVLNEAGKQPADVIGAIARSDLTRSPSVQINAIRVRGLEAQRFTESLYAAYDNPPSNFSSEVIDGKAVLRRIDEDGNLFFTYYHDEVAYIIGANTADPVVARSLAEAALRTLP